MKQLLRIAFFSTLIVMSGGAALAVQPDEVLKDARLEDRARHLSSELRCLVCQNQSIDDSDAPLARDLRVLVRERLQAGDSDGAVMDYVVARYGEFILLRPRLSASTYALWLAPLVILLSGAILARQLFRSAGDRKASSPPLSDEEARKLRRVLEQG